MPVPRRRHCASRRDKARTHKKLKSPAVAKCDNCGAAKRSHQVCPQCGTYRGRVYRATVTT